MQRSISRQPGLIAQAIRSASTSTSTSTSKTRLAGSGFPLIAGTGALALALLGGDLRANAALLVLILAAPALAWLSIPGDSVRRAASSQFLLIVAAAGLHGVSAALAVGLLGFALDRYRNPQFQASAAIQRIGLFSIVAALAYAVATLAGSAGNTIGILAWISFTAYWLTMDRRRGKARVQYVCILGWLAVMLAMPLWMSVLPSALAGGLESGLPALGFALWFMTLDTALATSIGLARAGRAGIQFWRREFVPTFTRYTILALIGTGVVVAFDASGFLALLLLLAATGVVLLILRDRALSERKLVATICALSTALDARDPYTKGHSDRVAAYAIAIALRLGWPARERRTLEIAAHLHDVGKIGIPDAVLLEPGRLTSEQFEIMKSHAGLSAGIVRNVPDFQEISAIIRQHHERLDGSGYPHGIAGAQLLPAARILGVADSFDAMTSNRPYRDAMAPQTALDELTCQAGSHYDPEIVRALSELFSVDELEGALQFGYCLTH